MALPTTNLTAHFDASDLSTLFKTFVSGGAHTGVPADGDSVEVWKSLVGSTTQLRATNKPVYREATPLMALPCLDFASASSHVMGAVDNSGSNLAGSVFMGAAAKTVIIACYPESAPAAQTSNLENATILLGHSGYFGVMLGASGGECYAAGGNYDGNYDATAFLSAPINASHVVMVRKDGSTLYTCVDGLSEVSAASGDTAAMFHIMTVGQGYFAAPFFNGRIGEIAVYDAALTGTDRSDAMDYFTSKWLGISAGGGGSAVFPVIGPGGVIF